MAALITRKPFVYLPLLLVYVAVVVLGTVHEFQGDESRYLRFTYNMLEGFYTPSDKPDLMNGPGYPLVQLPFIALDLPLMSLRYLNAVLLFGAVLYISALLESYIDRRGAIVAAYLFGLYPLFLKEVPLILTELVAVFCIAAFAFHFCRAQQTVARARLLHGAAAAAFLAYLAMTKIFFGYVITVGLLAHLGWLAFERHRVAPRVMSAIYAGALALCVPWLVYTYSITGEVFYWGDPGGDTLYWMSSPVPGHLGDWFGFHDVFGNPKLYADHGEFYEEILPLTPVEQAARFREKAIENILEHPDEYIKNWMANVGRILFSYPHSYTPQKLSTYFHMTPNMVIFVLAAFTFYAALRAWRAIPFEIWSLLLFGLITFGGSTLVAGLVRMFIPTAIIAFIWIPTVLGRAIELRFMTEKR